MPPAELDERLGVSGSCFWTGPMFAALGEAQKGWAGPGWDGDIVLLPKVENIRREKHRGEERGSLGLFGCSNRCHVHRNHL